MTKQVFEEEILAKLTGNGVSVYLNLWHTRRQHIVKQLNPENKSIDFIFIQAIPPGAEIPPEIEKLSPGLTEKCRRYSELQHQLLRDLLRLNKTINRELIPFQEWLSEI